MGLEDLLTKDIRTVAVVCNQYGDTGKGKIDDFLAAEWADINARGTGGANAGHTVVVKGKESIFHLLPSAIGNDDAGVVNVIGNGVAFEPRQVDEELRFLDDQGASYSNLRIAYNGILTLPQHLLMDRLKEALTSKEIGTTGRGIGPVYTDHVARIGLRVNDMLNENVFRKKLMKNLNEKLMLLREMSRQNPDVPRLVKTIMDHEHLGGGEFYHPEHFIDTEAVVARYVAHGKRFQPFIVDTDALVRNAVGKDNLVLEGAQGYFLSIDHGTYPFVTSSDATIQGLAKGVGILESDIDLVLGIIKGLYMTRVGGGPFTTELGGTASEEHCKKHTREDEKAKYGNVSVNDPDELIQGIAIRQKGGEYGATTKRARRTGWLDLPLLRRAMQTNGRDLVMTKIDVLDGVQTIPVCTHYVYEGDGYTLGEKTFRKGDEIYTAITDPDVMKDCRPVYRRFPGWQTDTTQVRSYHDLPTELREIIGYVEEATEGRVRIISVGPDRDQTIIRAV